MMRNAGNADWLIALGPVVSWLPDQLGAGFFERHVVALS